MDMDTPNNCEKYQPFIETDNSNQVLMLSNAQSFSIIAQARLAFCKFMVTPSTLLILDEPTNHLDIPSKEMLEVRCSPYPFGKFSFHDL